MTTEHLKNQAFEQIGRIVGGTFNIELPTLETPTIRVSFLREVNDDTAQLIVGAIAKLAHSMRIKVTGVSHYYGDTDMPDGQWGNGSRIDIELDLTALEAGKKFIVFHSIHEQTFRDATFRSFVAEDAAERRTIKLRDGYKPVAEIEVAIRESGMGMLEDVYRLTNHIDKSWYENHGVRVIDDMAWTTTKDEDGNEHRVRMLRSTSVGDVVLDPDTNEAFIVAGCGFQPINLEI